NGNLLEKVEKIRDNLKNIQRDIDKDPYNKALRKEEVAILKDSHKVEGIGECHSLFKNKVNGTEALSLIEDVSLKEIKDALFDIGDNKSPGPDGFSSVFFKKSWNIIGEDFYKAVKEFFKSGKMLKDINSTVISLIPKTQSPLKVSDYRPIACCNVVYKCISKVITGRLKRIIGNLKAYDTVNWCFLETIMTHFGFLRKMIQWIMVCVKTTSFTINVNGELCGFFKGGKGLRQGDPLSPYLFTLVIECFTLMMERNVQRNPKFQYHF
nr:hypothetical protein [Tanacetum cinerariifolium]